MFALNVVFRPGVLVGLGVIVPIAFVWIARFVRRKSYDLDLSDSRQECSETRRRRKPGPMPE